MNTFKLHGVLPGLQRHQHGVFLMKRCPILSPSTEIPQLVLMARNTQLQHLLLIQILFLSCPFPFIIDRTPAVQYNEKDSTQVDINEWPSLLDNEIQDLSDKMLQSADKKTIASHQSAQNCIEDNMEVEVKVELISVKPAQTTTSTAVDLTGGIIQERHVSHDVGVGKFKLPPTNSLQSGVPPAAK